MATEQNQLRTPDLPPEGPVFEDGNVPQDNAPQAPQPAARSVQEDAADRAEPQQWKDDKRSEIFNRARERRQQETEEWSGDPTDPDALYGSQTDQSDMGELEKEALRRRQEVNGQAPQGKALNGLDPQFLATRAPVVVDGETREVTVEEALRLYQINLAADKRLEQAQALLRQTYEFQQRNASPANAAGYEEPTGQDNSSDDFGYDDTGNTVRRPANAKELVEKIQLGTPEEAEQALADFIGQAVQREAPVDETTRVLTALEDANSKQAVLQFAQANPQIANSPVLQAEATREIQRNMALDLMKAGYTVEQLRELAPSPQHLTNLHKQARIQRLNGVRPVQELLSAGYQGAMENLRSLVGQTGSPSQATPAPSMQQRQQRKDALQTQPVARRLSPSLSAPSQQRSQDQSRSAAVMNMRKARGQPT